jgi:hypothetical protein
MAAPSDKVNETSDQKEQWVRNLTFSCVKCKSSYKTRSELMEHYDGTRHDRYSTWK